MTHPTPLVLLLYASVGSGHQLAAEAIAVELQNKGLQVKCVDLLAMLPLPPGDTLSRMGASGPFGPLYDLAWRSDRTSSLYDLISPFIRKFLEHRISRLVTSDVCAIVSTHALCSMVTVGVDRAIPRIAVLTDFIPHAYWPRVGVDLYCVGCTEAEQMLRLRGCKGDIVLTGIPVRAQFALSESRQDARATLGLSDSWTVAVISGGRRHGPYREVSRRALSMLRRSSSSGIQFVVLPGADAGQRRQLQSLALPNVRVLDYCENVAQYMAAADVIACKPGGSTLAECLAVARPVVLLSRGYGQERANAEFLESKGAGVCATSASAEALMVSLAADPHRMQSLARAAQMCSRPQAAVSVAKLAINLAMKRHASLAQGSTHGIGPYAAT